MIVLCVVRLKLIFCISKMEKWSGRVAVVCDFAGSSTGLAICKDLVNHGMIVCGLTKHEGMRALRASVLLKPLAIGGK